MKQLTTLISALFFLTLGVSQVWALPNCVGPWNALTWDNCLGTYMWDGGDKYVGQFKDGKSTGQGIVTFPSGNKYVGEVNDSEFNGQGTFTFANGDKHVGEYKDDVFHGQGTYTYASGNKYVGDFKDDKRHGQGTFTFASGSKEVGAWENNKLNGYAITYFADGSINQEGIFKDDKFLYAQKKSKVDKHKDFCEEIGFTPKTEGFGNCVLELMKKD